MKINIKKSRFCNNSIFNRYYKFATHSISIIHITLILFIIITPFADNIKYLIFNIQLLSYLSIRWLSTNDDCVLTFMEKYLTNVPIDQGFIYNVIKPICDIRSHPYHIYIQIFTIIYLLFNCYIFYIIYPNYDFDFSRLQRIINFI
jgi:hypothetical protein